MTKLSHLPKQSITEKKLSSYLVQQELGRNREGGRITYLATEPSNGQPVVIKQFRFAQTDTSWSGFKTYEREIAVLQAIDHPQVPRYLDSFEMEDGFCMVQEYKDAPSLAKRYHFKPQQIQQIAISLLEILADLQHQAPPIIHRDIKPENILVDDDLQVYLIDFGLAKLNQAEIAISSIAAGTPGFMPPEELFNRPLTTAADLYSVGATLISLLTQTPSTQISNLIDPTYRFNLTSHLPPLNSRFTQWLEQMVSPNPLDRFRDAATALKSLKAIDIVDLSTQISESGNISTDGTSQPSGLNIAVLTTIGIMIGIGLFSGFTHSDLPPQTTDATSVRSPEEQWFETIKPHCNTLEVMTAILNNPFPKTPEGAGFGASCYALAGKLLAADQTIQSLPEESRFYAARILFDIGHPVADRGDDESAGPIMDVVLKYWPENYMALYHAGMSAYVLAENDKAITHLEEFLNVYQTNDVWTQKARLAIDNINSNIPADERFRIHH